MQHNLVGGGVHIDLHLLAVYHGVKSKLKQLSISYILCYQPLWNIIKIFTKYEYEIFNVNFAKDGIIY